MSLIAALIMLAAICSALIGGLFFAFSTFVMKALGERPPAEGMAAMVSINRVILRSLFLPVFFGTALLSAGLAVYALVRWSPASLWLLAGAALYIAFNIVTTMIWNVPLNNRIDRADPAADNEALWRHYLDRWTFWNHVRTIACLVAAGLFTRALLG